MRIRKKPWAASELNDNASIINEAEALKGKWNEYFSNNNPIYIEIGCGKGQFITNNSIKHSDINFIGIERQTTIIAIAARKMRVLGGKAALILGDADGLNDIFGCGEVKRIYLNFSDPWPKNKWAKRRLTHSSFLERYKELFGEEGEIFLKTDNKGLFEFSLNELAQNGWQLKNISLDLHQSDFPDNIMTEYEERFSALGQPIYRLEARWENRCLKGAN